MKTGICEPKLAASCAPKCRTMKFDVLSCRLSIASACVPFALVVLMAVLQGCNVTVSGGIALVGAGIVLVSSVLGVVALLSGILALCTTGTIRRFAVTGVALSLLALLFEFPLHANAPSHGSPIV